MKRLPPPTERSIQRQIVNGLRAMGLGVIAVPNGGQYSGNEEQRIRMAQAKRADGEVAGFPDLLVHTKRLNPPIYCHLEVKRPGYARSTDHHKRQLECHAAMTDAYLNVAIVTSLDEAYRKGAGMGDGVTLPERYLAGSTLRELATECGVSLGKMRRELVKAGVTLRPSGRRPIFPTDPEVIAARGLWNGGATYRQIASLMKTSPGWAHRLVQASRP